MPRAVAFFPWIDMKECKEIEGIKLIPYVRGVSPAQCPHVSAEDLDKITEAYADRKDQAIQKAVLLEVADWQQGTEPTQDQLSALFAVREIVAFSSLAVRRLFAGPGEYCNYDHFELVVQSYQKGSAGAFSFQTRRRDGGALYTWSSTDFAFYRPRHVDRAAVVPFDDELCAQLLRLEDQPAHLDNAIAEFNQANTDARSGAVHHEIVMMKSAFEFLFSINQTADALVKALIAAIPTPSKGVATTSDGYTRWAKRRKNRSGRAIEGWAREFAVMRNESAHGQRRRAAQGFTWTMETHLAFAAVLFPLLVKRDVARLLHEPLGEIDALALECVEAYLCTDPFSTTTHNRAQEHPWSAVRSDLVLGEVLSRRMRDGMRRVVADSTNGSDGSDSVDE